MRTLSSLVAALLLTIQWQNNDGGLAVAVLVWRADMPCSQAATTRPPFQPIGEVIGGPLLHVPYPLPSSYADATAVSGRTYCYAVQAIGPVFDASGQWIEERFSPWSLIQAGGGAGNAPPAPFGLGVKP